MDALSDAIATARLGHPSSDTVRMTQSWCVRLNPFDGVGFLAVTRGMFWLLPEQGAPVRATEGAVILLLPRGGDLVISDSPSTAASARRRAMNFAEWREVQKSRPENAAACSGGSATEVLCGKYSDRRASVHPLLRRLPEFVAIPPPDVTPELRTALSVLETTHRDRGPGSATALRGVLDLVFVLLVRSIVGQESSSWRLSAGTDHAVTRALDALHDDPGAAWTSDRLARAAGVSRPTLSRRFADQLGVGPMAYVTRWRLAHAAQLLLGTTDTLSTIAAAVGYGSPYSFSHAFTKQYGTSPGRYRSASTR